LGEKTREIVALPLADVGRRRNAGPQKGEQQLNTRGGFSSSPAAEEVSTAISIRKVKINGSQSIFESGIGRLVQVSETWGEESVEEKS